VALRAADAAAKMIELSPLALDRRVASRPLRKDGDQQQDRDGEDQRSERPA
jgi:hypothetical protein